MTQEEVDQKSAEIVEYFSAPFIDRSKTTKTPEVEPYQSSYIEHDEASKKEAYQAAEADVEAKRQKESSFTFDNPMYEKKASPVLADETQFDIDKEKIALKKEMLESFYDPLGKLDKKEQVKHKKAYEETKAAYKDAEAAVEAKKQKEGDFTLDNPMHKQTTSPALADETQFAIDKEKIELKTEMLESFYDPLSKLDKKGKEEYKKAYEGTKAAYKDAEATVEAKRQKEEGFAFDNPLYKKSTVVGRSSDDGRKKMDELQAKRMATLEKDPEVRELGKLFLNPDVKTSGMTRGNFKTRKVNSKGM